MLINGVDLSVYGAKLYDRVISSNSIDTTSEWLDGDIQPTFVRQQDRFKDMTLSFLILGQAENDAFLRMSKLTAALKKASIKFDDLDYYFDVVMVGTAQQDRLKNGNFVITFNFKSDYAKGEREVYTTDANSLNSFKLTVVYYQNSTVILGTESVDIRAGKFEDAGTTLASLGIEVDKYRPSYYEPGVATNLEGNLTFEGLKELQVLIINYVPTKYNVEVSYFYDSGTGVYSEILTRTVQFTYPQLQSVNSIGQIIDAVSYKPEGCRTTIEYSGSLTVEEILAASPISVFYTVIENELTKNISIEYLREDDAGEQSTITYATIAVKESDIVQGMTYRDVINADAYRPNVTHFDSGVLVGDISLDDLVVFEDLDSSYQIYYRKTEHITYVEYYYGVYPEWYRVTSVPVHSKWNETLQNNFSLEAMGVDLNRYHTNYYEDGQLYNATEFTTYDKVLAAGILQVYYVPIDYPIVVRYYQDTPVSEPIAEETVYINEIMFMNNPILSDIIDINKHRPDGYQLDIEQTYDGEVSLTALTQASPIRVVYEEIEEIRAKNIIIKYRQRLASGLVVLNTSLIIVNESDCVGGVRLKDIINIDAYRPEYYESGYIDGYSSTALFTFDTLGSSYDVIYNPTTYYTSVRYYVDEIDPLKWIGSSNISYTIIDFTTDTTLFDLGLDLNLYKPSYCGDGVLQYNGPVNFAALRELEALEVIYETVEDPDDDGIDYPHRFLFLQHNDLGDYEYLHPEWTMNHSFINTGVIVDDMSKLTVIMECARVDTNVPLHEVNEGYGTLFGSSSSQGEFYMRFNNQTQYGTGLTGVNTYEAKAGNTTNKLVLTEENAVGFSENTGIYASDRDGYSYATFTYTSNLQTENTPMIYPLYLFADNIDGRYANGLAGIGIYGCRIYYNNNLIRDFIPVAFYDLIGDQVSPENCLYDKVTKTFFTDGSGTASFNIIDDDRYQDDNPAHNIGHCYVNYYKGPDLFQTLAIYFRESDFIDQKWDPYEKFLVDRYQPQYYYPGVIHGLDNIPVNFDNLNNKVFSVVYEEQTQRITVNYYQDELLLATEEIPLTEKDFYQAPTFGDIVRLNKYRPEGYETNFEYPDTKVSLNRVLAHSPYNILYVPETDTTKYTFKVRYMKETFYIREYETIAVDTIELTAADFRDGEYIDYHMDLDKHRPERFFQAGQPYGWYTLDERISSPDMLKDEYQVLYLAASEGVDIHYYKAYTDTDDPNTILKMEEIATATWIVKTTDFEGEFTIVDMLPNEYLNKFRPVNCYAGEFLHPEKVYTFETLVDDDDVTIVYKVRYIPETPDDETWPTKVLVWGRADNGLYLDEYSNKYDIPVYLNGIASRIQAMDIDEELKQELLSMYHNESGLQGYIGGRIPYIDLGYTPKQVNRLRVEMKCYVQSEGFKSTSVTPYGYQTDDYLYFFGYYGPRQLTGFGEYNAINAAQALVGRPEWYSNKQNVSPTSAGYFAFRTYAPTATSYVYTSNGPQSCEGQTFYSAGQSQIAGSTGIQNIPTKVYNGIYCGYRQGYYHGTDINWNEYVMNKNYEMNLKYDFPWGLLPEFSNGVGVTGSGAMQTVPGRYLTENNLVGCPTYGWLGGVLGSDFHMINGLANPFYITLDAYNGYGEMYTEETDYSPFWTSFDMSEDDDLFEGRPQVKGSITLFQTRHPLTGEVNIMPFEWSTVPNLTTLAGPGSAMQTTSNPYSGEYETNVTYTQLVIIGTMDDGTPIYETKTYTRNVQFAGYKIPVNPQLSGCAVWNIKIYDRDRLVRDLIPVAKGDQLYDYVAPANGLFDKVTEIFFANSNEGGTYEGTISMSSADEGGGLTIASMKRTIKPEEVLPLMVIPDPITYGKCAINYYDYDNSLITNQLVDVPTWFSRYNTNVETILRFNDYKPDDYHTNGMVDLDIDLGWDTKSLYDVYQDGAVNIYYKLKTFTKSIIYYNENVKIGSRDVFYSTQDIEQAETVDDLGIDVDLYWTENFQHGQIYFDTDILTSDDMQAFIDAPAPVVVYHKWTKEEHPELFYVEYYRGGASDESDLIWEDENPSYLNCNLDAKVLNPHGCVQYAKHYHAALYEDEVLDYFIPYQVRVINRYCGIHNGPGRKYKVLANIVDRDIYTITEERAGWGRLKEYPLGWIDLAMTSKIKGEGETPDYEIPELGEAIIPFNEEIHLTKLTIDRLWAYTDTYNCWVKTEEISYNQAGRLYNGLAIEVLNLDELSFDEADSFEKLNIYPQKYQMKYHDAAEVVYTGPWTYEGLSELHNIDFIYPETIYTLNCSYVDTLDTDEELGRVTLKYSLSDWNPDWDMVIETSFKYDENGTQIPPTLYRDTPVMMTWSFFGMDRDKFAPVGRYGIYCFNPYPWDIRNDMVAFEDMISVGTQTIKYIDPNWDKYGLSRQTPVPYGSSDTVQGVSLGEFSLIRDEDPEGEYMGFDFTVGFDLRGADFGDITYNRGYGEGLFQTEDDPPYPSYQSQSPIKSTVIKVVDTTNIYGGMQSRGTRTQSGFSASYKKANNTFAVPEKYRSGRQLLTTTDYVMNFSNYRDRSQCIAGFKHYKDSKYDFYDKSGHLIENNSKLLDNDLLWDTWPTEGYEDWRSHESTASMGGGLIGRTLQYMALYRYRVLQRLVVPAPGGYIAITGRGQAGSISPMLYSAVSAWGAVSFDSDNYQPRYTDREKGKLPDNIYTEMDFNVEPFQTVISTTNNKSYERPNTYSNPAERPKFENAPIPVFLKTDESGADWITGTWYSFNDRSHWLPSQYTSVFDVGSYPVTFHDNPERFMIGAGIHGNWPEPGGLPLTAWYANPWDTSPYPFPETKDLTEEELVGVYKNYAEVKRGTRTFVWSGNAWIRKDATTLTGPEVNKNYVVTSQTYSYEFPILSSDKKYTYYLGDRVTGLYRTNFATGWINIGNGWIQEAYLSEILT